MCCDYRDQHSSPILQKHTCMPLSSACLQREQANNIMMLSGVSVAALFLGCRRKWVKAFGPPVDKAAQPQALADYCASATVMTLSYLSLLAASWLGWHSTPRPSSSRSSDRSAASNKASVLRSASNQPCIGQQGPIGVQSEASSHKPGTFHISPAARPKPVPIASSLGRFTFRELPCFVNICAALMTEVLPDIFDSTSVPACTSEVPTTLSAPYRVEGPVVH